ncbi:dsRBD fold-containing protein [Kribbella sp. NPDC026596]|uniref:dsRBD fold-containing protein n=1 Tax=Kribbella sp. NPDC026596 TaxID=3155122 RepID=UPI0033CF0F3D
MVASRHWSVEIFIDEHEDERTTHAEARLHTNDKTQLVGRGTARRNPGDTDIAEIGDELAVARALSSLAPRTARRRHRRHRADDSRAHPSAQLTASPRTGAVR